MDFAQAVNLSLKRYLDAHDMKISVNESHSKEGMKVQVRSTQKQVNSKRTPDISSGFFLHKYPHGKTPTHLY